MSIPYFTEKGLLPVGIHQAGFADVATRFAGKGDPHRHQLWKGLCRYLNMLSGIGCLDCVEAIYIDGSFITDKKNPSDIDVVFEVNPDADVGLHKGLFKHTSNKEQIKLSYGVHPFSQIRGVGPHNMVAYFQRLKEQEAMNRDIRLLHKQAQKGIVRTYYE